MEILTAKEVSFAYVNRYQRVDALKSVSCCFETGKAYAIVGKSGSGKTTLLSLLAGLETPTEGEILFEGKSLSTLDRDAYRRDSAAVIYQSLNLFPLLTAEENVMFPLKLMNIENDEAKRRAKAALLSVGIGEELFKRLPSRLSGGEQQRVAIARAVSAQSRIILADEPTGNLDITNGDQVVSILLRLAREEGRCVIIVTHDLEIAAETDEVFMMKDGVLERGLQV
ncbi:MAG: ABC transporter ATP-binding protein [Clostridia bacterium]|nr:ABC transporter ATP-binding protein [Clostridia bacterium]